MFEISVYSHFSGAHRLRYLHGKCEELHGHNFAVEATVTAPVLNSEGIMVDFRDVKAAVKKLVGQLDHRDLNTLPLFQSENPTCENVARYLYSELASSLNRPDVRLKKVGVSETQTCGVSYWED